jgi:hypothetical protein
MRDGLRGFAEAEILPRHESSHDLFVEQRELNSGGGRFSDQLLTLIAEFRRAASKASYKQKGMPGRRCVRVKSSLAGSAD